MPNKDTAVIMIACASPAAEDVGRRIQEALADLEVETRWAEAADASTNGAGLVLVTDHAPAEAVGPETLIVSISDAETPTAPGAVVLREDQAGAPSRAWRALVHWVGARLERPALASFIGLETAEAERQWAADHPSDPLSAAILDSGRMADRLAAAERARDDAVRAAADARTELEAADAQLAAQNVSIANLQRELGETASALSAAEKDAAATRVQAQAVDIAAAHADDKTRPVEALAPEIAEAASRARRAGWLAEACATRARWAADAAQTSGEDTSNFAEIFWDETRDAYAGEVSDGAPHGLGVLRFSSGATYAGAFNRGRRSGFGVGEAANGDATWAGGWREDQPAGAGVWRSADGDLFEGAASDIDGLPRRSGPGALWTADGDLKAMGVWRDGRLADDSG